MLSLCPQSYSTFRICCLVLNYLKLEHFYGSYQVSLLAINVAPFTPLPVEASVSPQIIKYIDMRAQV